MPKFFDGRKVETISWRTIMKNLIIMVVTLAYAVLVITALSKLCIGILCLKIF